MQNSDDNLDQAPVQDSFTTLVNEDHAARIDKLVDDYKTHILTQLNAQNSRETTFSDRLADKFALFAGSWKFILIFTTFLTVWMAWNTLSLTKAAHFDVAPFILLNLILVLYCGLSSAFHYHESKPSSYSGQT